MTALLLLLLAAELTWVKLPGGEAIIGCDAAYPCARTFPPKAVRFPPTLEMMSQEVTVEQFDRFVKSTGYVTYNETLGERRSWRDPGYNLSPDQPVVFVTVADAQAFCRWAGARLPSDAEWEYAARAGSRTAHFWGDEIDERYLWYRLNSNGSPQPVGRKLPNRWGLFDVEGNVQEWVVADPVHTSIPATADVGSLRGGAWISCPEPYEPTDGVRQRMISVSVPFPSGTRQHFDPGWRRDDTGFRCIRGQR